MLKLKVLRGPKPKHELTLKSGENIVGRSSDCDVVLASMGISKRHAKIIVKEGQCHLVDLGSSNGTFVNGAKIQDRPLRIGDRIAFHDTILELVQEESTQNISHPIAPWKSNVAYQNLPSPDSGAAPERTPRDLVEYAKVYFEKVVLPGLFHLNELYPMRNILAGFVLLFIVIVTGLSTIPMATLMKEGVQKEAQRRALTIARQLAAASERALTTGNEASIRVDFAESEEGVASALVIAKEDGHIIAPLTKAQSYSNDEFVSRARKRDEVYVDQISALTIGASVPIKTFSPEVGQQLTVAFAQVIYKMDSLDWSATVGLFARVLIIALCLALTLYYLLYRILTQPIREASDQLDYALRGERDMIMVKYDFDIFTKFLGNVNSALSRMGQSNSSQKALVDRGAEASNLVRIVSDPAFAVDTNGIFLQVNNAFEELIGMRLLTLQGQNLEILQDQALKLNLEDLFGKAKAQVGSIVTSQLEISGVNYEIDAQATAEDQNVGYIFGTLKKRGLT